MKKQDITKKDRILHQKRVLIEALRLSVRNPEIDKKTNADCWQYLNVKRERVCGRLIPCNSTHDFIQVKFDVSESQSCK